MAYCSSSHLSLPCTRNSRDLVLCPFLSRSHLKFDDTWFCQTKKGIRVRNAPQNKLSVVCVAGFKAVVTGKSWEKSILKSETPVLVEFYASWCGPCRMVHRVIDELAEEYAGKLKCFILNTDKDSEITEEYEIKAVPVVLLFKNGEKCDSIVGTMPKEFYVAAIEKILVS